MQNINFELDKISTFIYTYFLGINLNSGVVMILKVELRSNNCSVVKIATVCLNCHIE